MSTSIINNVSYLRTSRNFPLEAQPLSVEINKAYVDIANAVNNRIIGIFATVKEAVTGESWFIIEAKRLQTFRRVYTFTAAGNIPHGITVTAATKFTRIYGTFTNGTNWFPLPYVDTTNATNQVNIVVTPTNIVITAGGGAPPAIVSGIVVLEWLSLH